MTEDVLQKLLQREQVAALRHGGATSVGGIVVRAADVVSITTPADLLDAYGLPADGEDATSVYVVRFPVIPLMRLGRAPVEGHGPVFPTGFLDGHPAPVWWLERTRFPRGAELWRVSGDAPQELISVYDGAGLGWRAATQYVPPSPFIGPRALFHGTEYSADIDEDGRRVTLVAVGEVPDGFTGTRPMISERAVAVAECDSVFERVLTCTWAGRRWRVLDRDATTARLLLMGSGAEPGDRAAAVEIEPGVYESSAPLVELGDVAGHEEVLTTA